MGTRPCEIIPTAVIGRSLGHDEILDKLGEGGMGAVYLAARRHREGAPEP